MEKLLNVHEAAEFLGVSVASLNKWRCTGAGPVYVSLSRRVAYRPEDLSTWIESRRRRSTSDPGAAPADAGAVDG